MRYIDDKTALIKTDKALYDGRQDRQNLQAGLTTTHAKSLRTIRQAMQARLAKQARQTVQQTRHNKQDSQRQVRLPKQA